jgi:murein DD-endopeptidase MepM/ murein hydrolase activator NlpD
VRIRHDSTYSTAYAHLKGFARGIRANTRVRQGDIIGYVGATGRATGPHLHYEVLKNNRQVSPRGLSLPAGESLSGDDLAKFHALQREIDALRRDEPAPAVFAQTTEAVGQRS